MNKNWENLDPSKLARLLDLSAFDGGSKVAAWYEEPATILKAQLAAPLLADLLTVPGAEETRLRSLVGDPNVTFADLLLADSPNLELLEAIKHFARHVGDLTDSPLHGIPANVLYFAAIAAALVHTDARITTLTPAQLHAGFALALTQPLPAPLASLFQQAIIFTAP